MFSGEDQVQIRNAMFLWLQKQSVIKPWHTRKELREGFSWNGVTIPLMDPRKGIWNPRDFSETVSITSTLDNPYGDYRSDSDDFLNYKYQTSPDGRGANSKLRLAFEKGVPLILFEEFEQGKYIARYPVYVTNDFLQEQVFRVSLSSVAVDLEEDFVVNNTSIEKAYAERTTLQRIHQPRFRARVLRAYEQSCAICKLQHVELLDAAHIIPDSAENGFAAVTNGLALCKIHHAAYDRNVIGITPEFEVRIRPSILEENDGPMLEYGIKRMHGVKLTLPKNKAEHPAEANLDSRYQTFLQLA